MKKAGIILLCAILFLFGLAVWFSWPVISSRLWEKKKAAPLRPASPSKEKLFEDDRRKLDELLKQKSK